MPLSDDVTVYPAHGAGSACGKNMMKETVDSLGNQKKVNYALRENMTREEFIKEVTDGLAPPPKYFPLNVKMNKSGYDSIDRVLSRGLNPLGPDSFEAVAKETDALILDVRHQDEFVKGDVPQSVFIGLDGGFAPWVGTLIEMLINPTDNSSRSREEETITSYQELALINHRLLKWRVDSWKSDRRIRYYHTGQCSKS